MYQLYRDRPLVVFLIVIANGLLSAWCIHSDPIINNDAVTYLTIAQMFVDGQWSGAFNNYSWPYYSIFIAITSKLIFLDIETSAYILNTFFATSLTLAFICIVAELSRNNQRIILIATVLILLFPSINKYRSFIIRDFGYLSCYLWSLYFIFRFCKTLDKRHLIGWLTFSGLSCLFRFEGIILMLVAPYFLFLIIADKIPHRRTILTVLSSTIVVSCTALVFWYVNDKYTSMIAVAKLTGEDINGLTDLFLKNIEGRLHGETLTPLNYLYIISANIGDVFYELIRRMAIFYFIFAIYAYAKKLTLTEQRHKTIWRVYLFTNLIMLIGFSMYNNFLVSRYTLATALTLLLLAPFAIDHLTRLAWCSGLLAKTTFIFVVILLCLISLDRLNIETDKSYLKLAGHWLSEHASPDNKIYSNNKLIIYYADRSSDEKLKTLYNMNTLISQLVSKKIRQYDYVALEANPLNTLDDNVRQTLAYNFGTPIKTFARDDGQTIFVFKHAKRAQ